jgi:hypothetical protein
MKTTCYGGSLAQLITPYNAASVMLLSWWQAALYHNYANRMEEKNVRWAFGGRHADQIPGSTDTASR